jgi:hypothetical protein
MAQKTLEETFHATRTTEFNEGFWNRFLGELGARFRALETIKIDWEVVSQEGIQVALDRINEVLGPAAERVQNIASLGFLTVESHSERTLAPGLVNFVAVQGDQLDLFVPTPFVAVTRASNPLDYAIGQVTFFDRATGSMDIQISYFEGDPGPHSDWVISAVAGQAIAQSSLLNQTLAARDIAVDARQDVEADRQEVATNTASVFELYGDFRDAIAPSGGAQPSNPKPNQLWFDGAVLRVWNGATFIPVAVAASNYYLKTEVDTALATKFAKTGGAITGNVDIQGADAANLLTLEKTGTGAGKYHFSVSGANATLYLKKEGVANYVMAVNGDGNTYLNNGAATIGSAGDISGAAWSPWGSTSAVAAIGARIEARAVAWANDRVSNLQYRLVSLGRAGMPGGTADVIIGGSTVLVGLNGKTSDTYQFLYASLQVYDPVRGWVGFSQAY